MTPEISVIIPTRGRPAKLAACLAGLAGQTAAAERYEVLVGLDGPDAESERAARAAWGGCGARMHVETCPRRGYNETRNRLIDLARGRLMLSLNDDVRPGPRLLEVHAAGHAAAQPAIITGYSPFPQWPGDSLFDRVLRETSMVFFYDQMAGGPPDKDWGFRHCWGMNFSAPLGPVREVGKFLSFPLQYGYDDIEIAWRLRERYGCPVLFRPDGFAGHDHRYGPREVIDREVRLGRSAWAFAGRNAAFCREVFGRDIRAPQEVAYTREFVIRERRAAERLEPTFLALADVPAGAIDGPHAATLLRSVYQQFGLLKRWNWCRGLLEAADQAA